MHFELLLPTADDPALPSVDEFHELPIAAQRRIFHAIHEAHQIAVDARLDAMRVTLMGFLHAYVGLYHEPIRRSLATTYRRAFESVGGRVLQ